MITNDWLTYFEKSNFLSSPDYNETMNYFKNFERETNCAKLITIGYSHQAREIKCLIVAKDNCFTPKQARRKNKAVILIQNGIHAGEIEGKDACMLLLRDILITRDKFHLIENLVLLVVPILNVDGHERISKFNRPNQNGPVEMGWRTNALNLNLNRDYMKADSSEMKSLLKLFNQWMPDLIIDNHTTNGLDYQYHITYGIEKHKNIDNTLRKFALEKFLPFVISRVEEKGFLTAPYIELRDDKIEDGIIEQPSLPRYSTGYSAVQNRLCLLVETHSLKPFENRVRSTKEMNETVLEFSNSHYKELKSLNKKADENTINNFCIYKKPFPVKYEMKDDFEIMNFKGYEFYEEESSVTGSNIVRYTQNKSEFEVRLFNKSKIKYKIIAPFAYAIPIEHRNIVRILKLHGIKVKQLSEDKTVTAEKVKFVNAEFARRPYEARHRVDFDIILCEEEVKLKKGTFIVLTNQRTLRVILNLLEPLSDDSFVKWGFFNSIFERKEYAEEYIFEPIANQMLEDNINLKEEFFIRLENDNEFKNNPAERLDFIYQQSDYFDKCENVYPVIRIKEKFNFSFV